MFSEAYWSCGRKKGFDTKKRAIRFASGTGLPHMSAYKCFYCQEWHLTSQERPKQSPRLRAARRVAREASYLSTNHHNPDIEADDISVHS